MGISFRALKAEEVECRVGQISRSGSGLSLLLFKTARTDSDILDETIGSENWQCEFYECKGTLFCKVGILVRRDDGFAEWVWKDDAGSPSNMEAAKGEASDAFKRACYKWGIGRELYTAPRIWIYPDKCTIKQGQNGKPQCYDKFSVASIVIEKGRIEQLDIRNDERGTIAFSWVAESYARRIAGDSDEPYTEGQGTHLDGLVRELSSIREVDTKTVLDSLLESGPVAALGGRIETARQAVTAIGQLEAWMAEARREAGDGGDA